MTLRTVIGGAAARIGAGYGNAECCYLNLAFALKTIPRHSHAASTKTLRRQTGGVASALAPNGGIR